MDKTLLRVEKINKTFGSGHSAVQAVKNVSFQVESGEVILIMGPSGSGKTTLLTMIGALLSTDSGKIFFRDTDITKLSKKQRTKLRSQKVGFVFQTFNLLTALNVTENIAVVLELNRFKSALARSKAQSILKKLGLGDRLKYRIADLSGGEKQRVSIARALAIDPKIILADEPTANLDSKSGHRVMKFLSDTAKKESRAVIIVSHDMRLMDIANRVLWLEDGIIKEGYADIVTDPVCKMKLQQNEAPFSFKHKGKTYYFCSKNCYSEFKKRNSKH